MTKEKLSPRPTEERSAEIQARITETEEKLAEIKGRDAEIKRWRAKEEKRDAKLDARSAELSARGAKLKERGAEIKARLGAVIAGTEDPEDSMKILADAEAHTAELDAHIKEQDAQARRRAVNARRAEKERARMTALINEDIAWMKADAVRRSARQDKERRDLVRKMLVDLRADHELAKRGTGKTASKSRKNIIDGIVRVTDALESHLEAASKHLLEMVGELDAFQIRCIREAEDSAHGNLFQNAAFETRVNDAYFPAYEIVEKYRTALVDLRANATRTLKGSISLARIWGLKWRTRPPEHPMFAIMVQYLSHEGLSEVDAWSLVGGEDSSFDRPRPLECLGDGEKWKDTWHTYWKRYRWEPAEASA